MLVCSLSSSSSSCSPLDFFNCDFDFVFLSGLVCGPLRPVAQLQTISLTLKLNYKVSQGSGSEFRPGVGIRLG